LGEQVSLELLGNIYITYVLFGANKYLYSIALNEWELLVEILNKTKSDCHWIEIENNNLLAFGMMKGTVRKLIIEESDTCKINKRTNLKKVTLVKFYIREHFFIYHVKHSPIFIQ
jgi:hypothetical protein